MHSPSLIVHRLAGVAFLVALVALAAVDVRSWRRTRPLRCGSRSVNGAPRPGASVRSSSTTFLAGAAGLAAVLFGLTTPQGMGWIRLTAAAAGLVVAAFGLAGRVRMVGADRDGLSISYAVRRSTVMSWADFSELRAPRTPVGGWRLIGAGRSRSLMPSDLLNHEGLLVEVIERAGLSFTGRRWTRGPPPRSRRKLSPG